MSLRVWLPLNGNLDNQGLDNAIPTLTGAVTVDNSGKIGKCYKFGTATGRITVPPSTMTSFSECSVTFWVYILGWQTNWDTFFQAGLGTSPWNSYTFGILRNSSNHVVFAISDGSTSSQGNYKSSDLALNTWHHLAFIYKAGHCCIYINGVLFKDYATTIVPKFSNITYVSIGQLGNGSNYQTNCKMNDFRIYDHALSPLEVKQISQGLVLHYLLNRGGFGVDNILINTHFDSHYTQSTGWDTTKNGTQLASSWGGYNGGVSNSSTVYHAHLKEFNGEWVYEYIKTANENWLGISQGGLQSKLTAGKTYTFSWEEYHVNGTNRVGTGLYYYKTGATSANFHLGIREAAEVIREIGRWQKYIYTFTAPSDADWSKNMSWYIYGHYNGNGTFYVRHIKLEEGSVATPWCPNSSDTFATIMGLNDNIEYDTSGYENNGTKKGLLNYDSNTSKYNISTVFNGSDTCIYLNDFILGNQWSYGMWFFHQTRDITWSIITILNNTGSDSDTQFSFWYNNNENRFQSTANTQYNSSIAAPSKDTWHHFFATFDGNILTTYIDGVVVNTKTITTELTQRFHLTIGGKRSGENAWGYYWKGKMSDYRVYCTALSAEDVKSLYNNSAYIDNQGNIYGAVYEEA